MLLYPHLPAIGQDFLIDRPWPRPLPLIGCPMMTDSPLATPTLALQCDHPPLANDVVARLRPVTHAGYHYKRPMSVVRGVARRGARRGLPLRTTPWRGL